MAAGRASCCPYRLIATASELCDSTCCKKPTQKVSADDLAISSCMSPLLCPANIQWASEKPETCLSCIIVGGKASCIAADLEATFTNLQKRCRSQRGSYNYTTLLTPHCISPYTPWDFRITWNKPFLFFSTLSATAISYFLLEQRWNSISWSCNEHERDIPFWQRWDLSRQSKTVKIFWHFQNYDFFQSLRISLYRACRNKAYSVWLCRKEKKEMLE